MIEKPENNNNTDKAPKKHTRFWVRLSIIIAFVLLIAWVIPYFFSNFLFKDAIKSAFSKLSKQAYTLDFDNLRINIYTQKVIFYNSKIYKSDHSKTDNAFAYSADTLRFQKLSFFALQKKQALKFDRFYIGGLKLAFEKSASNDQKSELLNPLNNFLNKIDVKHFSISDAEITYKQEKDTLFIPSLSLEINNLRIDSLKDTVHNNRFHYSAVQLLLKKQQILLPDNIHLVSLNQLKLSTKEKVFELNGFHIKPLIETTHYATFSADIPRFKLTDFEFDSLLNKKVFLAKNFELTMNTLYIQLKTDSTKAASPNLKKAVNDIFAHYFERIDIQKGSIALAKTQLGIDADKKLSIKDSTTLHFNHFEFHPKESTLYSLVDGSILFQDFVFQDVKNKQNFSCDQGNISYLKKQVVFTNLEYSSALNIGLQFQLKEAKMNAIDWSKLINTDKFNAERLRLNSATITQNRVAKPKSTQEITKALNTFISPLVDVLKIDTVVFEDWNYQLRQKAVDAKNIHAQIYHFELPSSKVQAYRIFSDFTASASEFSWVSQDQNHHYLANSVAINSQKQAIHIHNIQSFPRWKSLNNEPLAKKAHYKFYSRNIELKTEKPFYQINLGQPIYLQLLSIDSLNLKQFGKTEKNASSKFTAPPLHIAKFELKTGDFAAFNDSSVISRLAQVNGIHLQGDSLEIINDTIFDLNYKHLIAFTKNGFYQNQAKGLHFKFKKIDFDSKNDAIGLYQFSAELSKTSADKTSEHRLNSELLQIKDFNIDLFLHKHLISAKELLINKPLLISKGTSNEQQKADFQHLFSAENLEQLPYLEFDRFIVRDFNWLATYTVKGVTSISTFEKANFEARNFQLSNWSFTNPDRLFFSQAIHFQIENFKQHFQDGNYLLMIKNIDFSSDLKQLNLNTLQFFTLQRENENNYNFSIEKVSFDAINFADFQRNLSLNVNSILILKPKTNLRVYGFNENSTVKNINSLDLYPIIQPYFSQVVFSSIDVRDMAIKIAVPKGLSTDTYNLGHLNLRIQDFKVDSSTKAFQDNRFFYSQNTLIHLRDYSAQIANDMYNVNFSDLRLNTQSGRMDVDSVSLSPLYSYADFAEKMKHQSDRFDIKVNKIKLSGIDFQDALFRQKYKVQRADLYQLNGEVYRDGLYPRLPDYYPPNPIQRLLKLPYFIQVDSLLLNDATFAYKEKGTHTDEPGKIFFDRMNLQVLNVSNNPDFIKYGGNTVLNANAMLMGKSQLNLDVNFPLLEQGKSFKLNAHLNQIEIEDLEPILRPLALIQAQSGTIKSVDIAVEANDDYAFGNMNMLYSNLKVEVLRKSMKKGFFSTLFANALIKTENPSYLIPRKGPIYFERRKDRSLFNYWAEISILGMKTSMGLADRRISKKVKKLQEEK